MVQRLNKLSLVWVLKRVETPSDRLKKGIEKEEEQNFWVSEDVKKTLSVDRLTIILIWWFHNNIASGFP